MSVVAKNKSIAEEILDVVGDDISDDENVFSLAETAYEARFFFWNKLSERTKDWCDSIISLSEKLFELSNAVSEVSDSDEDDEPATLSVMRMLNAPNKKSWYKRNKKKVEATRRRKRAQMQGEFDALLEQGFAHPLPKSERDAHGRVTSNNRVDHLRATINAAKEKGIL